MCFSALNKLLCQYAKLQGKHQGRQCTLCAPLKRPGNSTAQPYICFISKHGPPYGVPLNTAGMQCIVCMLSVWHAQSLPLTCPCYPEYQYCQACVSAYIPCNALFLSLAHTSKQSSAHRVDRVGAAGTRSWTSQTASVPCRSPCCRRPRTRCHTRRHNRPGRAAPDQRPGVCAPACCTNPAPHLQSAGFFKAT